MLMTVSTLLQDLMRLPPGNVCVVECDTMRSPIIQMCPLALLSSQLGWVQLLVHKKILHERQLDRQRIELWTFRMQSEHSTTELRALESMSYSVISAWT